MHLKQVHFLGYMNAAYFTYFQVQPSGILLQFYPPNWVEEFTNLHKKEFIKIKFKGSIDFILIIYFLFLTECKLVKSDKNCHRKIAQQVSFSMIHEIAPRKIFPLGVPKTSTQLNQHIRRPLLLTNS